MEALSLKMILGLYLLWMFSGGFQVSSFHLNPFQKKKLDMALNSFDDQYKGCVDQMEQKLPDLLKSELDRDPLYNETWQNAKREWEAIKTHFSLRPLYAIAVLAYTANSLYDDFNKAVQKAGQSKEAYRDKFHYKSLHYLLTRAIQVIQNDPRKQKTVYRGMGSLALKAEPSKYVRFGQFTSSSIDKSRAESFGKKTFFTIVTSFGAFLDDLSFFPGEKEVLIPPFERFKVISFTKTKRGNNIELASSDAYSKYNCEFLNI